MQSDLDGFHTFSPSGSKPLNLSTLKSSNREFNTASRELSLERNCQVRHFRTFIHPLELSGCETVELLNSKFRSKLETVELAS